MDPSWVFSSDGFNDFFKTLLGVQPPLGPTWLLALLRSPGCLLPGCQGIRDKGRPFDLGL